MYNRESVDFDHLNSMGHLKTVDELAQTKKSVTPQSKSSMPRGSILEIKLATPGISQRRDPNSPSNLKQGNFSIGNTELVSNWYLKKDVNENSHERDEPRQSSGGL